MSIFFYSFQSLRFGMGQKGPLPFLDIAGLGLSAEANNIRTLPRFRITTKRVSQFNGIRIEPGMSVEVVTNSFSNPLLTSGGQDVVNAFMRIYGIDIKRAGILSQAFLDVERIG